MEHVPLPQRAPRRKRPRPSRRADATGAPLEDLSAGARAAAGVDGDVCADGHEHRTPEAVPEFVPGVPVFDGTSASPRYEYKDHTADIQIHSWGRSVEECFAWAALGMFNYMTPLENLRSSAAEAARAAGTLNLEDPSKPKARVPGNGNMRKSEAGVRREGAANAKRREANETTTVSIAPLGTMTNETDRRVEDEEEEETEATGDFASRRRSSSGVGYVVSVEAHDMHSLLFAFLDELLFRFHTSMCVCREIQVLEIDRVRWRLTCRARGETFVDGVHEQGTEIKAITYSAMQIVEKKNEGPGPGRRAIEENGEAEKDTAAAAEVFVIVDI
jgi:SHS2 domain-containing protein